MPLCAGMQTCLNTALISHAAAAQMQTFQTCRVRERERREFMRSAFVPALRVIKTQKETSMVHKYARTLLHGAVCLNVMSVCSVAVMEVRAAR
jgi:hypothetical protein